jgi:hypothetical protein
VRGEAWRKEAEDRSLIVSTSADRRRGKRTWRYPTS